MATRQAADKERHQHERSESVPAQENLGTIKQTSNTGHSDEGSSSSGTASNTAQQIEEREPSEEMLRAVKEGLVADRSFGTKVIPPGLLEKWTSFHPVDPKVGETEAEKDLREKMIVKGIINDEEPQELSDKLKEHTNRLNSAGRLPELSEEVNQIVRKGKFNKEGE